MAQFEVGELAAGAAGAGVGGERGLLELGTPPHIVQAIARHADLDVTMRIYAHTNLDSRREAVDKIDWGAA